MSERRPLTGEIATADVPSAREAGREMLTASAEERPTPDAALAPVPMAPEGHPDFRAGTAALAAMPDEEFEVRLIAMRRGRERITRIHRELMDPETDYGVIPGTKQPTLLKPGA